MAEIVRSAEGEPVGEIEKQLNDRSFKGVGNESGVASLSSDWTEGDTSSTNPHAETSGYESSGKTSWEDFEGEIINLSTFKLDCMQSSNIVRPIGECEISSIMHENGTPQLRKGNLVRLLLNGAIKMGQTDNIEYRWQVQFNSNQAGK